MLLSEPKYYIASTYPRVPEKPCRNKSNTQPRVVKTESESLDMMSYDRDDGGPASSPWHRIRQVQVREVDGAAMMRTYTEKMVAFRLNAENEAQEQDARADAVHAETKPRPPGRRVG
jgi:hypothetical protein